MNLGERQKPDPRIAMHHGIWTQNWELYPELLQKAAKGTHLAKLDI